MFYYLVIGVWGEIFDIFVLSVTLYSLGFLTVIVLVFPYFLECGRVNMFLAILEGFFWIGG